MWWYIGGLVALVVIVPTVLTFPAESAIVIATVAYIFFLMKQGMWRGMVVMSIAASVIRSSTFGDILPETAWYAAQFGPLVLAAVSTLSRRTRKTNRAEQAALVFLFLFVIIAAVSGMVSPNPSETYAQVALFGCVAIFLALTFTRRWDSREIIRGDLAVIFWTITVIQAAGLLGAFTNSWGYDPDYGRYVGLFSNANYAGVVSAMAISIGFFLYSTRKNRWPYVAAIAVLGTAMIMSGSRGAILAFAVGVLVLLLSRGSRRLVFSLVAGLALVGGVLIISRPDVAAEVQNFFTRDVTADVTSGRLVIYSGLLEQFSISPIIGTGYRTSELAAGLAGHNVYLSVLAETGIMGAMAFAALIIAIILASRNGRTHRPLVGVAVTVAAMEFTESSIFGFGGPTALTAWLAVFAFAAWGATMRADRSEDIPVSVPAGAPKARLRAVTPRLI